MTLLKMSLTGACLILLVTLIRRLALKRMPKRIFPLLWGVVLVRLLIPFPGLIPVSVPLPAALTATAGTARAHRTPIPDPTAVSGAELWEAEDLPAFMDGSADVPAAADAALPPLTLIWLGGGALTGVVFLCLYTRGRRRFRGATELSGPETEAWLRDHPLGRRLSLRALPGLVSPLTYGLFRPVILLPESLDPCSEETAFALEHEYTHVRRLDGLWKLLLLLALAAHWFNPAVWLMWVLANRDLELSCDEAVLRRFGAERRQAYAMALVNLAARNGGPLALGFGGSSAEKRIRAILGFRPAGALRRVFAAALVLCLCLCALGGLEAGASYAGKKVYRNGGLTLTVPEELADLVLVQTPELPPEQQDPEGDVVFRVFERESWELGQERHPGEPGREGLLFIILREPEDTVLTAWTRHAWSHELLARMGRGDCFGLVVPTFNPPAGGELGLDTRSERWKRWVKVCAWANELPDNLGRDNPDLTMYPPGGKLLSRFLADTLYGDERCTLRLGEDGTAYDLMACPEAEDLAWDLIWRSSSEYSAYHLEQQGTPLILAKEDEALYFWQGSDRITSQHLYNNRISVTDYFVSFADGRDGLVSSLLWTWYEALKAAA